MSHSALRTYSIISLSTNCTVAGVFVYLYLFSTINTGWYSNSGTLAPRLVQYGTVPGATVRWLDCSIGLASILRPLVSTKFATNFLCVHLRTDAPGSPPPRPPAPPFFFPNYNCPRLAHSLDYVPVPCPYPRPPLNSPEDSGKSLPVKGGPSHSFLSYILLSFQ